MANISFSNLNYVNLDNNKISNIEPIGNLRMLGSTHYVALKKDGTVVAAGNNGDHLKVSDWKDIKAISAGNFITVGSRSNGSILYAKYNFSSCGDLDFWKNVVYLTIGYQDSHVVGLTKEGRLLAFGDSIKGKREIEACHDIGRMRFSETQNDSILADSNGNSNTNHTAPLDIDHLLNRTYIYEKLGQLIPGFSPYVELKGKKKKTFQDFMLKEKEKWQSKEGNKLKKDWYDQAQVCANNPERKAKAIQVRNFKVFIPDQYLYSVDPEQIGDKLLIAMLPTAGYDSVTDEFNTFSFHSFYIEEFKPSDDFDFWAKQKEILGYLRSEKRHFEIASSYENLIFITFDGEIAAKGNARVFCGMIFTRGFGKIMIQHQFNFKDNIDSLRKQTRESIQKIVDSMRSMRGGEIQIEDLEKSNSEDTSDVEDDDDNPLSWNSMSPDFQSSFKKIIRAMAPNVLENMDISDEQRELLEKIIFHESSDD